MFRILICCLIACSCNDPEKEKQTSKSTPISIEQPPQVDQDSAVTLNTASQPIRLQPAAVHLSNGDSFSINIPNGFHLSVAAEGWRRLRFLVLSPDRRLFATDMFDR